MNMNLARELASLQRMRVGELQIKYAEVFGEATTGRNKTWLQKRIAWRIQANAQGGLTDRAVRRAAELANESDIRVSEPKTAPENAKPATQTRTTESLHPSDDRIPPVGDCIVRSYKSRDHVVTVLVDGFEYEGQKFKTLSAVAKQVSGQHCSGFRFFNLTGSETKR